MSGIERNGSGSNAQRISDMDRALNPQDGRQVGHSRERPVVDHDTRRVDQHLYGPGPNRQQFPTDFSATLIDGTRVNAQVPRRRTARLGTQDQNQMIHAMNTQQRREVNATDSTTYPGGQLITYSTWPQGADRSGNPNLDVSVEIEGGHVRECVVSDQSALDSTWVAHFRPQQAQIVALPPDPSRPLPNGCSPLSLAPLEIVLGVAGHLSVLEQRELASAGRAMAAPLLPAMRRLSDLKRAVDLVAGDLANATSQLIPGQLNQISDAVNDPTVSDQQRDEVIGRLQPAFAQWAPQIDSRIAIQVQQVLARMAHWPHALQEAGREAVVQYVFTQLYGKAASQVLDIVLEQDASIAPHQRIRPHTISVTHANPDWNQATQRMQDYLQQAARRPPAFHSIALRSALEIICRCMPTASRAPTILGDRGIRTAMFDAVATQAGQLRAKERDQVRQRLLANLDRLPPADQVTRRQALQ